MVSPPPHLPVCGVLPAPQSTNADTLDLSTISSQLTSLPKAISSLSPSPSLPLPADASTSEPTLAAPAKPPQLLSTPPCDAIIKLIHREGTDLPSICPCNTANVSDTKTHWKSEELHWAMGYCKFWNYNTSFKLAMTASGWMAGNSLHPWAHMQRSVNPTAVVHLTIVNVNTLMVHIDIAFRDCLSIGSFRYALILIDRATWYIWAFGLKNLLLGAILAAIRLFCTAAGSRVK